MAEERYVRAVHETAHAFMFDRLFDLRRRRSSAAFIGIGYHRNGRQVKWGRGGLSAPCFYACLTTA
jgi:hypothetical protein